MEQQFTDELRLTFFFSFFFSFFFAFLNTFGFAIISASRP